MTVPTAPARRTGHPPAVRAVLVALCAAMGASALYGGVGLVAGDRVGMPADWPQGTPLHDRALPGLALLAVVALPSLTAARGVLLGRSRAPSAVLVAGALPVIQRCHPLQPVVLIVAAGTLLPGGARRRRG